MLRYCYCILLGLSILNKSPLVNNYSKGNNYYFSANGNDTNNGSIEHPLKTIKYLNSIRLKAGDSVFFKAGEIFTGSLLLNASEPGSEGNNIVITSYGKGNAVINGSNGSAIEINNLARIMIYNLTCKGSGRKDGNTKNGIAVNNCNEITIENIDISGFQKSGLSVYNSSHIIAKKIYTHENGFAGISISGEKSKGDCHDIYIGYCNAENNPGDPTNFTNHSGNGIIAGLCSKVMIEYCTASNNGWDMPRVGNGPVGIWCYESDSVTIQHCISYKNKTSKGGEDGGGYDLDGGVTNSVIQYCLSYENQGSAFGIFQYNGASSWHDNTIRFCISENDGNVSAAHANVYVWNSSHDSTQMKNLLFYNNTIYNSKGAAMSYSKESDHANFYFYNNIFIGENEIITGKETTDVFLGNDWYSIEKKFSVNGFMDFKTWAFQKNKEQIHGEIKGINVLPGFKNAGTTELIDVNGLHNFDNYKLNPTSSLRYSALNLHGLFGINIGTEDFNGNNINENCMGASTQ